MNIEELKMILETINATTGLAKDMGTTWIWLHYGFKFLINLTALAGVAVVAYAVYRVARVLRSDCIDTVFMRECRNKLNTGSLGCMTDGEYYRTTAYIMELVDKHIQEKA
jgi:hypothetical protein